MKIAVLANDGQWEEINNEGPSFVYYRLTSQENLPADTAACLWLRDDMKVNFGITSKPIFINSVSITLKEMNAAPNVLRINGWNSFISRSTWEIAGKMTHSVQQVCAAMGRTIIPVPDEPGFVSARVIAMIINEAYFALEDKISTPEEIDIAMKLGTNYPFGPFEWASIIGVGRIFDLLQKLSTQDQRYNPAQLLKASLTA
jgi:3-hydroxybutyryl-CoA dehydrogenase